MVFYAQSTITVISGRRERETERQTEQACKLCVNRIKTTKPSSSSSSNDLICTVSAVSNFSTFRGVCMDTRALPAMFWPIAWKIQHSRIVFSCFTLSCSTINFVSSKLPCVSLVPKIQCCRVVLSLCHFCFWLDCFLCVLLECTGPL